MTDFNSKMSFGKLFLAVFTVINLVAADWTTQPWDIIIVGAGPAGIVGQFTLYVPRKFFLN